MRVIVAFLLPLCAVQAQDAPPTFTISVEQGWRLSADTELDFPSIQEGDLVAGLTPKFTLKTSMNWPMRDRDGRVMTKPTQAAAWKTNGDPLKLEASLAVFPDGACTLKLKKVDYVDRNNRCTIELEDDKVRTVDLGGKGKWSGSRKEWSGRVVVLETGLRDLYLKATTPQKASAGKDAVGLDIAGDTKAAWRLYVTTSIEDQLAIMVLCRLDGIRVEPEKWPAEVADGPERPKALARALLDRLQAQARGTFATEPAKAKPGTTLKDQPWKGTELAVPYPGWMDGRAWCAERLKPVDDAKERLRGMTVEPNGKNSTTMRTRILDPGVWRSAVEDEAKKLRQMVPVEVPSKAPAFADALLPRTHVAGTPTYDYKEKSVAKDGQVQSTEADVAGLIRDFEVIFFHSGPDTNVWRSSTLRLETWYKGRLKRD